MKGLLPNMFGVLRGLASSIIPFQSSKIFTLFIGEKNNYVIQETNEKDVIGLKFNFKI